MTEGKTTEQMSEWLDGYEESCVLSLQCFVESWHSVERSTRINYNRLASSALVSFCMMGAFSLPLLSFPYWR